MTSSAVATSAGGAVRPRTFAAFKMQPHSPVAKICYGEG